MKYHRNHDWEYLGRCNYKCSNSKGRKGHRKKVIASSDNDDSYDGYDEFNVLDVILSALDAKVCDAIIISDVTPHAITEKALSNVKTTQSYYHFGRILLTSSLMKSARGPPDIFIQTLAAQVCSDPVIFVVYDFMYLKTIDNKGTELDKIIVSNISDILSYSLDISTIAAARTTCIEIYNINAEGNITKQNEINLYSGTSYSMRWLEKYPYNICVLSSTNIKIYDITVDCISPVMYFQTNPAINFISLDFNSDESIMFITTDKGHIMKHQFEIKEGLGPQNLNFNYKPTLNPYSYVSTYKDLVFYSSNNSLIISHDKNEFRIKTDANPLKFLAKHPSNPNLYIFVAMETQLMYCLEIFDDHANFFVIQKSVRYLGIAIDEADLYIFDQGLNIDKLINGEPKSYITAPFPISPAATPSVSPSFWTSLTIMDSNQYITKTTTGQKFIMHLPMNKMTQFNIKGISTEFVIVAFFLRFSGTLIWLKINKRPVKLHNTNDTIVCIPLAREEIGFYMCHMISYHGISLELADFSVYCYKASKLGIEFELENEKWMYIAKSIFDFRDTYSSIITNITEALFETLGYALPQEQVEIPESDIRKIIRKMYSDPLLLIPMRRILLKTQEQTQKLCNIWRSVIQEIMQEGLVDKKNIEIIQRDLSLLDNELEKTLIQGDIVTSYSISDAFML